MKNKLLSIVGVIFALVVVATLLYVANSKKDTRLPDFAPSSKNTSSIIPTGDIPTLALPLNYFIDDSVAWGSVNTARNSDDKNTWKHAAIDGGDAYQSFPTTTITLSKDDYSNEIRLLPPTITKKQYLGLSNTYTLEDYRNTYEKNLHTDDFFIDKEPTWDDVFSEFGDFGTRFLSGKYDDAKWDVASVEEVDINDDRQKEKIVYLSEDLNHFDQRILIIKDQKIIFSINGSSDSSSSIVPSKTGNGFYVEWVDSSKHYESTGYCCPKGYMKTRFVFENGIFVPVYEQEVLYFKVENID